MLLNLRAMTDVFNIYAVRPGLGCVFIGSSNSEQEAKKIARQCEDFAFVKKESRSLRKAIRG